MRIFLGADHNGLELKAALKDYLTRLGHQVVDEGNTKLNPEDDFPLFASRVVSAMLSSDEADPRGILICGSGQGMCMAANRFKGIRSALCWNTKEANAARNDDNSNVLCLSARSTSASQAEEIANVWLGTAFAGAPRFIRRLKELDQLA
ncbi:MAG: RpiB/LacA/LacB family sugar-phosphate isomerase [Candidatus Saccharimonadales bacterium]